MDRLPTCLAWSRFLVLSLALTALTLSGCKFDSLFKSTATQEDPVPTVTDAHRMADNGHSDGLWLTSIETAMQKAAREKKRVMVLFTGTDWCSYCVKLEKEVFETPEFEQWVNNDFVPVKLDFPRYTELSAGLAAQNEKMRARYKQYIGGYPTVLFLDQEGTVVGKIGYQRGGPQNWIAKAEGAITR